MVGGLLILGVLLMVLAYFHARRIAQGFAVTLTWWERHGAPIQWYGGAILIVAAALAAIVGDVTRGS